MAGVVGREEQRTGEALQVLQPSRLRGAEESRESIYTNILTTKWDEPSCYFTTGFLNGFFSAVKDRHVKETKCIGMGDPYCEWEFT